MLSDKIHYLCNKFSRVCLVGDFNLHEFTLCLHDNVPVPPLLIRLEDALYSHFIDQIPNHPSRGKSYLCLVLCSKFISLDNVQDLPPLANSDRRGQSFNVLPDELLHSNIKEYNVTYDFNNANYIGFDAWLNSIDWCCWFNDVTDAEIVR